MFPNIYTLLRSFILSIKIGFFCYTIDLLFYYDHLIHKIDPITFFIISFCSIGFFIFNLKKVNPKRKVFLTSLFILVGVVIYTKGFTGGDPIFEYCRWIAKDRVLALHIPIMVSAVLLVENFSFKAVDYFENYEDMQLDRCTDILDVDVE